MARRGAGVAAYVHPPRTCAVVHARPLRTSAPTPARALRRGSVMAQREAALARELAELGRAVQNKRRTEQVRRATADLPPLDDATLEAMYQELLIAPTDEDRKRLSAPSAVRPLDQLAARLGFRASRAPLRAKVISALHAAVAAGGGAPGNQALGNHATGNQALGNQTSCFDCARDRDTAQTREVLALLRAAAVDCPATVYNRMMDAFASRGELDACMEVYAAMDAAGVPADAYTKHIVTKAYAHTDQLHSALQHLAHWEASEPAPISAYTLVMEALLKHRMREVHAVAWSVFYHMRLAAHPVPDAAAYAVMLRACAAGVPQPGGRRAGAPEADAERALDLFREMTVHHGMRASKEVYDALILTCARRREHYADAVRLVRELLDDEHAGVLAPTEAAPVLCADTYTLNALLQGSARAGDLRMARWVLAEMLRAVFAPDAEVDAAVRRRRQPNEETMTNVFWASPAPLSAPGGDGDAGAPGAPHASPPPAPSFPHTLPRTSADVVFEARALMARILADQGEEPDIERPLASVHVTPRLLNAFLSVLVHHLAPSQRVDALVHAVEGDDGVFAQAHVQPNGHTLALLLEACALHSDRTLADSVAARAWTRWHDLVAQRPADDDGRDAKTTSRMWAFMIRNEAKSFHVDRALALLRSFIDVFPPGGGRRQEAEMGRDGVEEGGSARGGARGKAARDAPHPSHPPRDPPRLNLMPVPPPQSTLELLYHLPRGSSSRGRKRRSGALTPPHPQLTFHDLELLHHRCVATRNVGGLNLITRVAREYRRGGKTMKGVK
ncbi:hypothetical protein MSPP1_000971 [Malassezia sp. CBS 17886]|nr:hypothetical protein MSPP1_000971 [Malassezia sp. CBS 17886]